MRAITVSSYGADPSVTELPTPQAGPGQMLIATRAAGMNPMDMQIANGGWQNVMTATFPMVLGADLAGTVREDGPGAAQFAPGDEVFGQLQLSMTAPLLDRLASRVASGSVVPPPITRLSLDDVPAFLGNTSHAQGETVIII